MVKMTLGDMSVNQPTQPAQPYGGRRYTITTICRTASFMIYIYSPTVDTDTTEHN